MTQVLYNENPTITDQVVLRFLTPDSNGCLLQMPYKVDNVTIYFVERDFSSGKTSAYDERKYDPTKLALAEAAEVLACATPTPENITNAKLARATAEASVTSNNFYFNDAVPIKIVGNSNFPAWLGYKITGITAANPVEVTTENTHDLATGDTVYLYATDCIPPIDDAYKITVTGANTFTIDYDLSGGTAGSSGVWMSAQINSDNALKPVVISNQTTVGLFEYVWEPVGAREGDYFVCWTWTSIEAGSSLSSHLKFSLGGNTQVTTSIPTHFTDPKKYDTLLERYTPEMFKMYMTADDKTPSVIDRLNKSIALGFTTLENLANQIVDLQDANSIHESLLPYLSNMFNLKLKTADPTRWRGQIKRAIPQFKKKGTKGGLEEGLEHASMKLLNIRRLWQIKSKYTWQESFLCTGSKAFVLEKELYNPPDPDNMELYLKTEHLATLIQVYIPDPTKTKITSFSNHGLNTDDEIYIYNSNSVPKIDGVYKVTVDSSTTFIIDFDLSTGTAGTYALWHQTVLEQAYQSLTPYSNYVNFSTVDGVTTMNWISTSTNLKNGDLIRILYQTAAVPSPTEQLYEMYLRSFPLIDQRDESEQIYPLKNWNVRGLPEDDPFFDTLIPVRHPFHEFLVYGKIRTEFPYSENIYNMEEYNGSIRNSKNPCDIDRQFIDPCQYCISSSYNIDVEVDNICDDRINEFYEVIRENTPFHAVLHTVNFYGTFDDFIMPPAETIECYVKIKGSEFALAGEGQMYFNRNMNLSNLNDLNNSQCIFRGSANPYGKQYLVDIEADLVLSGASGTVYNDDIVVYNNKSMERIRISPSGNGFIKVTDGPYSGTYQILTIDKHVLKIDPVPTEPIEDCNDIFQMSGELNTCTFPFRVFNIVIDVNPYSSMCNIYQDNYLSLSDTNQDWGALGVQTVADVARGTATGTWTIELTPYGTHDILDITPQGELVIDYDLALVSLTSGSYNYKLYDENSNLVIPQTGTISGNLTVVLRAKVEVLNTSLKPINRYIRNDNFYQKISGVEYKIIEVLATDGIYDYFWIEGYNGGDVAGANLIVYERILDNQIGYMSHRGLNLVLPSTNVEYVQYIQNGTNQYRWDGDGTPNMSADPILPTATTTQTFSLKENFIVVVDDGTNQDSYWMESINGDDGGDTLITISGNDHYWQTLAAGGTPATINIYRYVPKGADIMGQVFDQPDHSFSYITRSGSPNVTAYEGAYYTWNASNRDQIEIAIPYVENTLKTLVTTKSLHKLSNNDEIVIYDSNPSIDGEFIVTVIDDNKFLIDFDMTALSTIETGFWHVVPKKGGAFSRPDVTSATKLFMSFYEAGGRNQYTMLTNWATSGYLHFVDGSDTVVCVMQINNSKIAYAKYYEIPVVFTSGDNLVEGQQYRVFYNASILTSSVVQSLAAKEHNGPEDFVKQKEAISYKIDYINGAEEKGEL